ncbi:hypothetical protein M514_21808 [Trichuris suis]|uniref:Uncharacterized protein n=1 Tax=Trichuris suis TaxID=68888 RepID=A0A085N939_9BILA|nr:hypothetical protein M514_21808 [Trichuris suis]
MPKMEILLQQNRKNVIQPVYFTHKSKPHYTSYCLLMSQDGDFEEKLTHEKAQASQRRFLKPFGHTRNVPSSSV